MTIDGQPPNNPPPPPTAGPPSIPAWVPPLDTGQPSAGDLNAVANIPRANFAARNTVIPIPYGRDKYFGKITTVTVDSDTGCMCVAYAYGEGEIAGYEELLIDGEDPIANGHGFQVVWNKGFESGDATGWTLPGGSSVSATAALSGAYGLIVPCGADGPNAFSIGVATPPEGTRLRIQALAQRDSGSLPSSDLTISVRFTVSGTEQAREGQDANAVAADYTSSALQTVTNYVTVPANATSYRIDIGEASGSGQWFVDDVEVEIVDVDANDEVIPSMKFTLYTGSAGQPVDGTLVKALSGYVDTNPGVAYIVGCFPPGTTNGFPRLEAIYNGRKVYDPRKYNLLYDDQDDHLFATASETVAADALWFSGQSESTAIGSVGWATATASPSPAGATYAELVDNSADSDNLFSKPMAVDTSKTYTVTCYAKQATGDRLNYLLVAFEDAAGNNIQANADSSTGWTSQGTYYYWGVVNSTFPGGWTQYSITFGAGTSNEFPQDTTPVTMRIGGLFARDGTTSTTIQLADLRVFEGSVEHSATDSTTWEYSTNPALCFRDMITNFSGWEVYDAGIAELASYNDEIITGTTPRRELGLTILEPETVEHWAQVFRTYMGGFLGWEGGKVRVVPNRADVDAQGALVSEGSVNTEVSMGDPAGGELDFGTSSFTVECWFKTSNVTGTHAIVCKKDGVVNTSAGYSLYVNTTSVGGFIGDGTNTASRAFTTDAADGQWHHLAMVVNRGAQTINLVYDGVATSTNSTSSVNSVSTTEAFRLFADETANEFNGVIDEVRVWNDVRTTQEITDNMYAEIENPLADASLVGYWKLNERVGTTSYDASGNGNHGTWIGDVDWTFGNPELIPAGVAMHITADDLLKDSLRVRRRSLRQVPNSVAVDYRNAANGRWTTEREQTDSPRLTAGGENRRLSRVSLPGIHSATQAKREATERLNWYLTDLEASCTLFDEGWQLQHGAIVALTHPIGLVGKLMRVTRTTEQSGRWTVDMVEYDPAVYSDEVVSDPTIPDTNLGDPLHPPLVTGLSAAEELFNYRNGITGSRIRVTFNPTVYSFFSQYLIQGYVNGVKVWETTTQSTNVVTPAVEELIDDVAVNYTIRVAIQSPFAIGAYVSEVVSVQGKLAPPGDVPSVTATVIDAGTVELEWGAAQDIDIWRYEVRIGTTSDTWATATFSDLMDDLDKTITGLSLGTHRFFVKAVDSVRNYSNNAAYADATIARPPPVTVLTGFEVASEVRLRWEAPTSGFVRRYRVAYDTIPASNEVDLDVVDTLTFNTKDVAEGTWRFLVYSVDDLGNEAQTPATVDIDVTSDAEAFLADSYSFSQASGQHADGSTTNMHQYALRLDTRKLWVTNMGDVFSSSPSDFNTYSGEPLANYHSSGSSEWLSETHDFGIPLTGSWNLSHDVTALAGNVSVNLEVSLDDVTYTQVGIGGKGNYQYARVRVNTTEDSTAFVMSPLMYLKVNVVPIEENGSASSSATDPVTINLIREYTAVKEINIQPRDTTDTVFGVPDNLIVGPNTAINFGGTVNYLDTNSSNPTEINMTTNDFTIECWIKSAGTTGNQVVLGKRNTGTATGWELMITGTTGLRMSLDDNSADIDTDTGAGALPNDGAWHHVAVLVDRTGNTCKIRVDHVEKANNSISTLTGSLSNTTDFALGARNDATAPFDGRLDEVRVWNDIRSTVELSTNADGELDMTQTQAGLVAYYQLNGSPSTSIPATADSVTDRSGNANHLTMQGAGAALTYIVPGETNPVKKINSFDVYIFDIFGQQLAHTFQWNWKGV